MDAEDRAVEILAAWRAAKERGEAQTPQEVIDAHPDLADELRVGFSAASLLERAVDLLAISQPSSGEASEAGRALGDYRIVREIGRGGMGVVYEAVQESMGRRVALKVLYPSVAPAPHAVRRFRREAQVTGTLKHTNIVAVHGLGQADGLWYCAMELVEGPPLSRVLERVRADARAPRGGEVTAPSGDPSTLTGAPSGGTDHFRRVARMFAEIADALQVAHEAGVLHRDVKPSNLMLDADGHLRLIDFGLARLHADGAHLTRTGDAVGTPLYMSPEQFLGGDLGPPSDVYSLGATLYETLTLRPPHEPQDRARLASEVARACPPRPRSVDARVPLDLETVVLKSLEKDPARRYATAAAFADDLRAFAAGDAIRARRPGPVGRVIRLAKRHPARTAAVAIAFVGAAAAGVLAAWGSGESDARRLAEYRLLLQSAVTFRPDDGDEGASRARPLYEKAIALEPDRAEAYEMRALAGHASLDEGLRDVASAAERGTPAGSAALLRAYLYGAYGRRADADAALQAAGAEARSDTPLARLVAGRRAFAAGAPDEAEREYEVALAAMPRDSVLRHAVLAGLVAVRIAMEQHAKALDDVRTLQALGDDRVKTSATEAWLWRRLGKEGEASARAQKLIERALEAEGDATVVAQSWVGTAPDWLDALTERGVKQFPGSAALWALRARAHASHSRWDLALMAWDSCLRIQPDVAWVRANRARTLANLDRFEEALTASARAVEDAPADVSVLVARADVCRRASRPELCERALREALRLDPRCLDALRGLALVELTRNRLDEAERLLSEVLRARRGDAAANQALGQLRMQQGRWADALASAEMTLAVDSMRSDAHTLRGRALRKLARDSEAEAAFRCSLALRRDGQEALDALGLLLEDAQRWVEAEAAFRSLLAKDQRDAHAWNEVGNCLKNQGRLEPAIQAYETALSIRPQNLIYVANVAAVLVDAHRADAALPLLDRVVREQPLDPIHRYNRALAYTALGRTDDAIRDYLEQARLDPKDAGPLMHAAALLLANRRVDEAVAQARVAVSRAPKHPQIRHDFAVMLLRSKHLDEATDQAREAAALAPENADNQYLAGSLLLQKHLAGEALPYLEAARRLAPDKPGPYQDCAAAYFQLGREAAAVDVLADAARRFPDDAEVRMALAWALADAADLTVRDPAQAAIHARRATALDAKGARNWLALGVALFRQDLHVEAISQLERARSLSADDVEPAASLFLAMAYQRSGRAKEAREAYDRAQLLPGDAGDARSRAEAAEVLGLAPSAPVQGR